ncbi:MAG TPA: alpha/beta hydrolase [Armatimonadota bacterium]|nr:alpha/beta hydrolase [Armatimonadota bacterium]
MRGQLNRRGAARSEELAWTGTTQGDLVDGVREVALQTNRGDVAARYHPAPDSLIGVVWVGGAGGGLDGPAHGLYPEACRRLQGSGVAGLRLHYRLPNHLENCVLDTLLGVEFLASEGIERVGLVGHSFGGAVVISAGANSERVKAVVPMSTQTYGAGLAPEVAPRPMLLIHGTADEVLPDTCSRRVYEHAGEPKELVLYPGARHGLDEAREEILELLERWLPEKLSATQ